MQDTSLCQTCRLDRSAFFCHDCFLSLCIHCTIKRHQVGSLSEHSLVVVLTDESRSDLGSICPICTKTNATQYCCICECVFCNDCVDIFHANGSARDHKNGAIGPDKTILTQDVPKSSIARRPKALLEEPLSLSQSLKVPQTKRRQLRNNSQSQGDEIETQNLSENDVITFKIDCFGVSVSLQSLLEATKTRNIERKITKPIYLSINCKDQVFKVVDKGSYGNIQFMQPLSLLHSAKSSQVDPRQVSITFKKDSLVLEAYAQNAAEATQIAMIVNQIRRKEGIEFTLIEFEEGSDLLFPMLCLMIWKKGKLKFSPRFISVKSHYLHVFRSPEDEIAVNSVDLLGASISRLSKKSILVSSVEKKLHFKLESYYEREIVFAVLKQAGGTTTADMEESEYRSSKSWNSKDVPLMVRKTSVSSETPRVNMPVDELMIASPSHLQDTSLVLGVYDLMKKLRDSFDEGTQLTSTLSLPKAIWTHPNVKIPAYQEKTKHFTLLNEHLQSVVSLAQVDIVAFGKSLVDFVEVLETIQNALSAHLNYIHAVKKDKQEPTTRLGYVGQKMRKYGHSLIKKATRATVSSVKLKDDSYQATLYQILVHAQLFETILEDGDEFEHMRVVFDRIQDFFKDVFCTVLMNDLKLMALSYMKDFSKSLYCE